jgi:hypothetical protein
VAMLEKLALLKIALCSALASTMDCSLGLRAESAAPAGRRLRPSSVFR